MGMSRSGELARWRRSPAGRWSVTRCSPAHLNFSRFPVIDARETQIDRRLNGHESTRCSTRTIRRSPRWSLCARTRADVCSKRRPFSRRRSEDAERWDRRLTMQVGGPRALELNVPASCYCQRVAARRASVWDIRAAEAQSVFLSCAHPAMRGELCVFEWTALINEATTRVPRRCGHDGIAGGNPNFRRVFSRREMRSSATAHPNCIRGRQFRCKTGKID